MYDFDHLHQAEERAMQANREKNELQARLAENEEEISEIMKKYKMAVQLVRSNLVTFI